MLATLEMMPAAESPQSPMTDEELLIRFRENGDRDAFEQLVHRYERELFSYLRRYLGDAELAEDAFQASFLQVFLKVEQFEVGRRFRPWLYTVATNQAIDAQRRNKRHRMVSLDRQNSGDDEQAGKLVDLLAADTPDPLANANGTERRDWVRKAVTELPESMQAVVNLVYYQGMKYREAADVLGVPVGTVKSRMHTAILKLNESWNNTHTEQT